MKDIPFVIEIENLSFPNPWSEAAFRGEIENYGISFPYVLITAEGKRIIGYVIYWKIEEEVQISNICIHPDYRRMGVGKKVMKWVFKQVKAADARYMLLEVRPSNHSAIALYEKLGFITLGAKMGYYINPPEDAVVMGKLV